jgi:hypothetical protein
MPTARIMAITPWPLRRQQHDPCPFDDLALIAIRHDPL